MVRERPGASALTAFGSQDQPRPPASGPAERVEELVLYRLLYRRRLRPEAYVRSGRRHDLAAAGRWAGPLALADVPGLAPRHSDRPRAQPQPRDQRAAVAELPAWTLVVPECPPGV
jgi:hypothetical protein